MKGLLFEYFQLKGMILGVKDLIFDNEQAI